MVILSLPYMLVFEVTDDWGVLLYHILVQREVVFPLDSLGFVFSVMLESNFIF